MTATFPPTTTGGVGEVAYNLQKFLTYLGVDTFVITSGQGYSTDANTMRIPSGKTSFVPMSTVYYLKKIHQMRFDVVNIQEESGMGVAPFLLAKKARTKIVTTLHTSYIQEANALKPLIVEKQTLASPTRDELMTKYFLMPVKFFGAYLDSTVSNKVIAICRKTMEDCSRDFRIPMKKMSLVYNGVDVEKFNPNIDGSAVRDLHKLGDKPVLLYVGRSEIRKGFFLLLRAMQGVISEIPDTKLMVVGAHVRTETMDSLLNQLGIQRNVIFAGKVSKDLLPQYYAASDLVVLPSTYEGLPLIVLEAMASGKAVAASKVGGVPEAVENGVSGVLFNPSDVSGMAKSILSLLRNNSMRRKMGDRGRRIAEERFDWEIIAQQYIDEFENML